MFFGFALMLLPVLARSLNTFRLSRWSALGGISDRRRSKTGLSEQTGDFELSLSIPTVEEMEEVGALLSYLASPPDSLFLDGDLGAGKTTFARGFINFKLGIDESVEVRVTSPTYLLSNTYEYRDENEALQEIHHMDLYRLSGSSASSFDPLRLDHVFKKCISLVEWPGRLSSHDHLLPPPESRLNIDLSIVPSTDGRLMTLTAAKGSTWINRLQDLVDDGFFDDILEEQ